MGKVFISYRRSDSAATTNHIYRELAKKFGAKNIFFDIDSIDGGQDFTQAIAQSVTGSSVVLAMIGEGWLNAEDEKGRRRLDDPDDFVREEIGLALSLPSVTVIPVILNDTKPPTVDQLPRKLSNLSKRNAIFVREGRDFEGDVQRLIAEIEKALPKRAAWLYAVGAAGLLLLVVALGAILTSGSGENTEPTPSQSVENIALIETPTDVQVAVEATPYQPVENITPQAILSSVDQINNGRLLCDSSGNVLLPEYSGEILFQRIVKEVEQEDETIDRIRDIFLLNLATCEETNLTSDAADSDNDDQDASWLSDGKGIIFASDRSGRARLHTLDLTNNQINQLASDELCCSWRPIVHPKDPTVFYFHKHSGTYWNIYSYNSTTRKLTNITNSEANEYEPDVSPDGNYLVFTRDQENGLRDVIRRDLINGTEVNLTETETLAELSAAFSPDGNYIVYSALFDDPENENDHFDIWKMNADGSNKRQLTYDQWASAPKWSADGQHIVYSVWGPGADNQYSWDLYIMNADGTLITRIMDTLPKEDLASWRPGT